MKSQILKKKFIITGFILGISILSNNIAIADTYFRCSQGYSFQSANNAARCHKPAGYQVRNLSRCASVYIPIINKRIGHFYKKNHSGNRDMCVGQFKVGPVTNTNSVEIGCPSGYSKRIKTGKDNCRKRIPEKTVPPTRSVNI